MRLTKKMPFKPRSRDKRLAVNDRRRIDDCLSASSPNILTVQYVETSTVKPDPVNPRKHSIQQVRRIARDIEKHGVTNPLLVTMDGRLIAGHARLAAANLAGIAMIPVIKMQISEADAKIRNIWDNKSSDLSQFDNRLLGEALQHLVEIDVDIEETGFSVAECDLLIQDLLDAGCEEAEGVIPSLSQHVVTKVGDLWKCTDHRVMCGDAEISSNFNALMEGMKAHCAFTDPPYNRKARDISGKGKAGPRSFAMASGEMSEQRYRDFLSNVIRLMADHSAPGAVHFHCVDWRHLGELKEAADRSYSALLNLCVWVKSNGGMGSLYRSRHELVLVYRCGKSPHRNNVELGRYGRNRTNVWNYDGATSLGGRITDEGNLLDLHPTVKPVQMIADALLDCTARGDVVLDPFLGSGSTLIAAERVGRRCFGLELDPRYVDVVIRRWQLHTGCDALQMSSGLTFDQIARGRHGKV